MAQQHTIPMALSVDRLVSNDFLGFLIVEKCLNSHLRQGCVFPGEASTLIAIAASRCSFTEPVMSKCLGQGNGDVWHYSFPLSALPSANISAVAAVVFSKAFCPEAFLTLAKVLAEVYVKGGNSAVTTAWLDAYSKGTIALAPNAVAWNRSVFDPSRSYRPTGLKALLGALGVEGVLVWSCVMMGKKVAVLAPTVADAVRACRVLPLLALHRFDATKVGSGTISSSTGPASLMIPYVTLSDYNFTAGARTPEGEATPNSLNLEGPTAGPTRTMLAAAWAASFASLQSCPGGWVAGFTDPGVAERGGDLWDCLVDLRPDSKGVVPAEASKVALGLPLSPLHKQVAQALLEALSDPNGNDGTVLTALQAKSLAFTQQLRQWFPEGVLSGLTAEPVPHDTVVAPFVSVLRASGVPASADRFLWGVALTTPSTVLY